MTSLNILKEWGEELEKRLRLKTFPLAIKMLEKEDDVPVDAHRPLRDFGFHLSLCQSFQISRREGATIASLAEDMWCFESVVGYGFGETPQYFLEGHNRYPHDVKTPEAGRNYARDFPRLEVGKYVGIVSAPLTKATFEPDLVMIYCDSAQLSVLLMGREWRDGHSLNVSLSSHAACVFAVVPALVRKECQVAIPCRGDHYRAMAGDDELIFTLPMINMEDLMAGIRHVEKAGTRLPHGYSLALEYSQAESYEKIAMMIGYRGKSSSPWKPNPLTGS